MSKELIKKLLRESLLSERKQIGLLYHFTNFASLIGMIDSNFRLSSKIQPYVSFTRNKRMVSNSISQNVRLTINGDLLTDKYKITPYADLRGGYGRTTSDESEERISLKSYPDGVDISNVLLKIELNNPLSEPDDMDDEDSFGPPMLSHFQEVIKHLKSKNIPFTIVDSFK